MWWLKLSLKQRKHTHLRVFCGFWNLVIRQLSQNSESKVGLGFWFRALIDFMNLSDQWLGDCPSSPVIFSVHVEALAHIMNMWGGHWALCSAKCLFVHRGAPLWLRLPLGGKLCLVMFCSRSRVQCLHTHFSHILVCVAFFFFWVTIYFSKKQHFLESLSHSIVAQNICKAFFLKCDYNEKILSKILKFCKL